VRDNLATDVDGDQNEALKDPRYHPFVWAQREELQYPFYFHSPLPTTGIIGRPTIGWHNERMVRAKEKKACSLAAC
jgi:hypothetical protein